MRFFLGGLLNLQPDNARHCINGNNLISINMIKVNLGGCSSFVKDADYSKYVGKALDAFDVLQHESGATPSSRAVPFR